MGSKEPELQGGTEGEQQKQIQHTKKRGRREVTLRKPPETIA
jgi:hypothetical protein